MFILFNIVGDGFAKSLRYLPVLSGRNYFHLGNIVRFDNYRISFFAVIGRRSSFSAFDLVDLVSLRGIGAALQLTADQFSRVWPELQLTDEERHKAEALSGHDEKFALLWRHLPLTDLMIAKLLGTERQKVINLRKAAGARLSRRLAHRSRAD